MLLLNVEVMRNRDLTAQSDGVSRLVPPYSPALAAASDLEHLNLTKATLPTTEQSSKCSPGGKKRQAKDELVYTTRLRPSSYRNLGNRVDPCRKSPSFSRDDRTRLQQQTFHDSAYGSGDVKDGVPFQGRNATNVATPPPVQRLWKPCQPVEKEIVSLPRKSPYPNIRLQPESSPISQEQLAAEVKGIYAGLVMVEAKCINIDSQKAANPDEPLGAEQWQALIALHRTLLYEHHDFLMATQHPSANAALRGLAMKYHMPARMWKHGIHAFLEVLRHRRPDSQEYMLAFIYLAYQMKALLYETVPVFTDTWIECLGDLARYRMAIEEDKEVHATWGGVAGRWYTMASDKHPKIGRLYHHLGILERPSLRKFYFYARSLTSVMPFLNAKESLATLCSPILNDSQGLRSGTYSAEAMLICYFARVFSAQPAELVEKDGKTALALLADQPHGKISIYGTSLAVVNAAATLGFGAPDNIYQQAYDRALGLDPTTSSNEPGLRDCAQHTSAPSLRNPSDFVITFAFDTFNAIISRQPAKEEINDLLPYIHVSLVFFTTLDKMRPHLPSNDTLLSLLDHTGTDWTALSRFLNRLSDFFPLTSRIEMFARSRTFPAEGKPLYEDYAIRGLVWSQWYFPLTPDWFDASEDDDGSRALEDPDRQRRRAERVQYLGLTLAEMSGVLRYDETRKVFYTAENGSKETREIANATKSASARTSVSGDDFVMVQDPGKTQTGGPDDERKPLDDDALDFGERSAVQG